MLLADVLDDKCADAIFQEAERKEKELRARRRKCGRCGTDRSKTRVLISASCLFVDN